MPTLLELREELEKGEILCDTGADDYRAVAKNEYGKYVYMYGLEPRKYFQTFEELVAHTEGSVWSPDGTLEDRDIEGDDWEAEPEPSPDTMERYKALLAAIAHGDEHMALLFTYKHLIYVQRAQMDKYPRLKDDVHVEKAMAAIEKHATKLLFEVANRKRTKSLPEWRKQYQAFKDAGEEEQAEYLWDAEIRKGMQAAQERMREHLRQEMEERY
jgi:hypothetical protein